MSYSWDIRQFTSPLSAACAPSSVSRSPTVPGAMGATSWVFAVERKVQFLLRPVAIPCLYVAVFLLVTGCALWFLEVFLSGEAVRLVSHHRSSPRCFANNSVSPARRAGTDPIDLRHPHCADPAMATSGNSVSGCYHQKVAQNVRRQAKAQLAAERSATNGKHDEAGTRRARASGGIQ